MRYMWCLIAAGAVLVAGPSRAGGQGLRSVGEGPSTSFLTSLPSHEITRTLGRNVGFTTVERFLGRPAPQGASYLAAAGINVNLLRTTWTPASFSDLMPGPGVSRVTMNRVRSIDSMSFERRARFAKLREAMLALEERVRTSQQASLGQISFGFRQFMFPFPLTDQRELGYGFFSRMDLVGGGTVDPEAFLSPFTPEVQQSLGEKRFQDLIQALLAGRQPPEGTGLDQFYDSQLAALGNYLFNFGRYEAAASVWSTLAKRDPNNSTVHRAAGLCLLASRQMKSAASALRRSLTLAHGWPDKTRIVGSNLQDVFANPQDLADARAELHAQLAKQPADADLGFVMAFADLFQGRWSEAEERLAKLAPADEVAKHLAAILKAGSVADTVRRPAGAEARLLAEELTGLEAPPLSAEDRARLVEAIRSGGKSYEDHMRIGDFRFFMGEFTLAGESYREAHKARPDAAFPLFALTHASFANGEYKQAARYLEQALGKEPNWGLYEFRIQEFYGDPKEFDRHLRDLMRQVELRPKAPEPKFLLAYVYYFSGRYADAADLLSEVLRLEPGFEKANYFLRLARLQG